MSRKERQLQQRRMVKKLLIVWGILGIIGFVGLVYTIISWLAGLIYGVPDQTPTSGEYLEHVWTQEEALQDGGRQESAQDCLELYEANKELLVLVNREHALEEGAYEDSLRSICNGRLKASDYLYADLVDLLAAADEEGHQYWIASAYRSRERQQELVDEDVTRYMAQGMSRQQALEKTYEQTMPAGKSEHETGLALDILCSENLNMDVTQANEPGNKWLAEHAHEYGFILRYPADKEEITAILYEPWHFRYVGKEAALFLWENNLTLEEFWEILESEQDDNFQVVVLSHADRFAGKPAHCRGVRRMRIRANMSTCEQAPSRQFGSSAHGSLLAQIPSYQSAYTSNTQFRKGSL